MKDLKQILETVEVVTVTDGSCLDSKIVVRRGFMEFQISRSIGLNSRSLLPEMDVRFESMDGVYLGGFSGTFVTDEETVMLNKMFIDAEVKTSREESKLRDSQKDRFWDEMNK